MACVFGASRKNIAAVGCEAVCDGMLHGSKRMDPLVLQAQYVIIDHIGTLWSLPCTLSEARDVDDYQPPLQLLKSEALEGDASDRKNLCLPASSSCAARFSCFDDAGLHLDRL